MCDLVLGWGYSVAVPLDTMSWGRAMGVVEEALRGDG